jgi:hypothetical protein
MIITLRISQFAMVYMNALSQSLFRYQAAFEEDVT